MLNRTCTSGFLLVDVMVGRGEHLRSLSSDLIPGEMDVDHLGC